MLYRVFCHTKRTGHFCEIIEADSADAARITAKKNAVRSLKVRAASVTVICVEEVKEK